jgi:ribosomal protein S18 acetylase RimI-like enzyme
MGSLGITLMVRGSAKLAAVCLTIRAARKDDEPLLRALDQATWTTLSSPAPRPPPERSFYASGAGPAGVQVATLDGALVGYVALGPAVALESNRHVLEVKGLAVDPAHRGRGIGRRLMAAAAQAAAAQGARRLTLRVLAHNDAARRVYEASGFRVEGVLREEFLLDGRYVDDVLMALDLPAG